MNPAYVAIGAALIAIGGALMSRGRAAADGTPEKNYRTAGMLMMLAGAIFLATGVIAGRS
jgi:drug/metabolite transporter (DMT)-like permease